MLSAIIFGSRMSLVIGLFATLVAMVIGVSLGLVSGYAGGKIDAFIMRVADVQLSFPAILIALLVDGVARVALPKGSHDQLAVYVLIVAIAASGWVSYARTVRGSTLVERGKEYVQAARVIGRHPLAIMFSHVLPNVHGPGAGDRHASDRGGHHHRIGAILPRCGRSAHAAVAGHADSHRERLPVLGANGGSRCSRGWRW